MTLNDEIEALRLQVEKPLVIPGWSDGKTGNDIVDTRQGPVGRFITVHKMRAYPSLVETPAGNILSRMKRTLWNDDFRSKVMPVSSLESLESRMPKVYGFDEVLVELYGLDILRDEGKGDVFLRLSKILKHKTAMLKKVDAFEGSLAETLKRKGKEPEASLGRQLATELRDRGSLQMRVKAVAGKS